MALLPAVPVGLPRQEPQPGTAIVGKIVHTFHTCPIPEIARLGRTLSGLRPLLRAWRTQFLAYFTTSRANNGGTEAINGIINSTAGSPAAFATSTTTA